MIGILNLGYGNTRSLMGCIERLGYDCKYLSPEDLNMDNITHLVIPGVGNFAAVAGMLETNRLYEKINHFISLGKPTLGICLGMQILTSVGHESGVSKGLDYIQGVTKKLESDPSTTLPHVGWNNVNFIREHPILRGIKNNRDFFFSHSYVVELQDENMLFSTTKHSVDFPSVVGKKNVVGTQFHPEKSLKNGMRLLENFFEWRGEL